MVNRANSGLSTGNLAKRRRDGANDTLLRNDRSVAFAPCRLKITCAISEISAVATSSHWVHIPRGFHGRLDDERGWVMTTSASPEETADSVRVPKGLSPLPQFIFASRWLQLPLYLGLIVAQVVYVIVFLKDLWHLVLQSFSVSEQMIMLVVLGLIDVVMISNLLIMVIVGGYETFVSRMNLNRHPDQPEWLSHVNASVLKIKLAMAIIGISSIHLLRTFIEAGSLGTPKATYTEAGIMWQSIIHGLFILSAIGIAVVDRLGQPVYGGRRTEGHA